MTSNQAPDALAALTAMTKGQPQPGGCDDCIAEQILTRQAPGVYVLTVMHDQTCPKYTAISRTLDGTQP